MANVCRLGCLSRGVYARVIHILLSATAQSTNRYQMPAGHCAAQNGPNGIRELTRRLPIVTRA